MPKPEELEATAIKVAATVEEDPEANLTPA